jgi:hypothetical protein
VLVSEGNLRMECDIYGKIRDEFERITVSHDLTDREIAISAKTLSPDEAIGNPERSDFPLLKGRERLMQAEFNGSKGQAFTDMYGNFRGTLQDVTAMELRNNYRRAIFIASLNAVMRRLGLAERTVHCRDSGMEECASDVAKLMTADKIAFIGFQPALVEACARQHEVMILDMDKDTIGTERFGSVVIEGDKDENLRAAVDWCDVVYATGSSIVNGTISDILETAAEFGKRVVFYGTTVAGAAVLLNLERFCPRAT